MLQLAQDWEDVGGTVSWVVFGKEIVGLFSARDSPRSEAKEAVTLLKSINVDTIMLTGDNKGSALTVQKLTGIEKVYSQLLPEEKVEKLKEIRSDEKFLRPSNCGFSQEYANVAMVGDGVNDTPALALASVGIAMGAMT
eukprot:UN12770